MMNYNRIIKTIFILTITILIGSCLSESNRNSNTETSNTEGNNTAEVATLEFADNISDTFWNSRSGSFTNIGTFNIDSGESETVEFKITNSSNVTAEFTLTTSSLNNGFARSNAVSGSECNVGNNFLEAGEACYYKILYFWTPNSDETVQVGFNGINNTNTNHTWQVRGYSNVIGTPDPSNKAPIMNSIADQTVNEGSLLNFTVSATDEDNDELIYSVSSLPTGATFNPSTQEFSWTPNDGQNGSYEVIFNVTDGTALNYRPIHITVNDAINPQVLDEPQGLIAVSTGPSQINIRWDDAAEYNVSGTAIRIYRNSVFVYDSAYDDYPQNRIGFVDTDLEPNTKYIYTISFVDADSNESALSDPATAFTRPYPAIINADSQILTASSLGDWLSAGVDGSIPDYPVWDIDIKDTYGIIGDGIHDDTTNILNAMANCPEKHALLLPAGNYRISQNLEITKPMVLRGESPTTTHITAEQVMGQDEGAIGIYSDWSGVENLHVHLTYPFTALGGRKIHLQNVNNAWIKNVETSGYSGVAVLLSNSHHCEIRDSYFHNSYEDSLDGDLNFNGYGVSVSAGRSSYNLVENNIFDWFRHAICFELYKVNNVIAYNFSWNVWTDGLGRSMTTDIEFHHIPYHPSDPSTAVSFTLIEGNAIDRGGHQNASHRNNTWLRNHIVNGGIAANTSNNIIGNEFTEMIHPDISSYTLNSPKPSPDAPMFMHGNYVTQATAYHPEGIVWDAGTADHEIPDSYYLTSKPDWFGDLQWPPFGSNLMPDNKNCIPAMVRYWTMLYPEVTPNNARLVQAVGNSVTLSWDNMSDAGRSIDFIISRSSDGVHFERVGETTTTTYTDSVPENGNYYYYIRARNYIKRTPVDGTQYYNYDYVSNGEIPDVYYFTGGESDPSSLVNVNINN